MRALMTPATRSALIVAGIAAAGFALSVVWVSREALRVRRERNARLIQNRPETGDMVWVPTGRFTMGSIDGAPDEQPIHDVKVNGLWVDRTEVTNEQFSQFIAETGYVTDAEKPTKTRAAGAFVFNPQIDVADFKNELQWWKFVPGAYWREPEGPGSNISGREKYPVVQVTWADANAYASWAKKRLPTEAEWEYISRGGVERQRYPWGQQILGDGGWRMNAWQGIFPRKDTREDGFTGLAPVASFPANSYGLFDASGNVAEWCGDWYLPDYYKQTSRGKDSRDNPPGPEQSFDPDEPGVWKRVIRGGSWLSSEPATTATRLATRGKLAPDVPLASVGFRCVRDAETTKGEKRR